MQNAKDTFYEVLRDRVAAGNAGRTVVVRGVVRPAVVVEENEIAGSVELLDCFQLRWTGLKVDSGVVAQVCEVRYATAGSQGGLDRGRLLAAMDGELASAVGQAPQSSVLKGGVALASGGAAVELGSQIWWSDAAFAALSEDLHGLHRVATVTVWSFGEAGEA
jgi:hypothetical protein